MDLKIHASFLPQTDFDAALIFYRDVLGFEVRADVGGGAWRWITMGPPDQPDTSVVLEPPTADPGLTDAERQGILERMAKGTYVRILLSTNDLDETFARIQAAGTEVVQEPIDQTYGIRDCAFRDPSGNLIRISQAR